MSEQGIDNIYPEMMWDFQPESQWFWLGALERCCLKTVNRLPFRDKYVLASALFVSEIRYILSHKENVSVVEEFLNSINNNNKKCGCGAIQTF